MARHDFGLCGHRFIGPVLQRHGDALVERLALVARQHAVGGILNKRVTKRVSLDRRPRRRQQLGLDEPLQGSLQGIGWVFRHDREQKIEGEFSPDRRGDPGDLPGLAQPVESRGKRCMQAGGNDRHLGRYGFSSIRSYAALHDCFRQFLDEQRYSIGSRSDAPDHGVGEVLRTRQALDKKLRIARLDRLQFDLRRMRLAVATRARTPAGT